MSVPWYPRRIRMRLTLLYATLFLASGIVLLAVALYLVFRSPILVTFDPAPPSPPSPVPGMSDVLRVFRPATGTVSPTWATVRAAAAQSAGVLAAMAVMSALLGWIVAGRVLSPLRTMTFRTRRISEQNLHERLALAGPRDEMTELATTIDGLLGRLEAAFQAQRRFIANASHELRTPLAMMRTSLDVAVAKPARPREVDVLAGSCARAWTPRTGCWRGCCCWPGPRTSSGWRPRRCRCQTCSTSRSEPARPRSRTSTFRWNGRRERHSTGATARCWRVSWTTSWTTRSTTTSPAAGCARRS
ncbi:HAMP domain-containing protein [Catenulispora sp. NL8]|uniref:histidine kinase n=1 Tax=Catenulispora pinistramenti TaxID=2705254 RepID=A0ABS5KWL1_9ACTN|nr:HAMP domain-containing protein [Catenulispora pinistramenti]